MAHLSNCIYSNDDRYLHQLRPWVGKLPLECLFLLQSDTANTMARKCKAMEYIREKVNAALKGLFRCTNCCFSMVPSELVRYINSSLSSATSTVDGATGRCMVRRERTLRFGGEGIGDTCLVKVKFHLG